MANSIERILIQQGPSVKEEKHTTNGIASDGILSDLHLGPRKYKINISHMNWLKYIFNKETVGC